MAWFFADSFDTYDIVQTLPNGYWDTMNSGAPCATLVAGRFAGSQAFQSSTVLGFWLTKNSGANDSIHHITIAYMQTQGLSGATLGGYLTLGDGSTAQCTIVFRSDGAILLTSGGPTGTVLATYPNAVNFRNEWFLYEFEVVINNTGGSFSVRKGGTQVNSFSATGLNTRGGTTNNYANQLVLGQNAQINNWLIDDFIWRSDPVSVAWLGDIRCYSRRPATDVSIQYSRVSPATHILNTAFASMSMTPPAALYVGFLAKYDGTINNVLLSMALGYTGNMRCALFSGTAAGPTTVLAAATAPINNPVTGNNSFTFSPAVAVSKNTQLWAGFCSDSPTGSNINSGATTFGITGCSSPTAYAVFPLNSVGVASGPAPVVSIVYTASSNATIAGPLQYNNAVFVNDGVAGASDTYNISGLAVEPPSIVAVVTRGIMAKSDNLNPRSGSLNLTSGTTTVQTPTETLSTSMFWTWRVDVTDPNTGAPWTPSAVDNLQVGPVVIS
jgi:hypothetical protein